MAQCDFSYLPFGAGGIPANENSGTSVVAPRWYCGTAAPSGTSTQGYNLGDVCWNISPSVGSPAGWICTTAGTGTSYVFTAFGGTNGSTVITTTITSGTLVPGTSGGVVFYLNPGSACSLSLPEASAFNSGAKVDIKNISANAVTLVPLGTDTYVDQAAITLVQNQTVQLETNGTTNWYSAAPIPPPVLTTTATSGTLTNGVRLTLINPATTGTYSLPNVSANYAGFTATFQNIASGSVTLTALASNSYAPAAAITLAQYASVTLISPGPASTIWYRQQ